MENEPIVEELRLLTLEVAKMQRTMGVLVLSLGALRCAPNQLPDPRSKEGREMVLQAFRAFAEFVKVGDDEIERLSPVGAKIEWLM